MKKVLLVGAAFGGGLLLATYLRKKKPCPCLDCGKKVAAPASPDFTPVEDVELIPSAVKVSHTSADEKGFWDTAVQKVELTLDNLLK